MVEPSRSARARTAGSASRCVASWRARARPCCSGRSETGRGRRARADYTCDDLAPVRGSPPRRGPACPTAALPRGGCGTRAAQGRRPAPWSGPAQYARAPWPYRPPSLARIPQRASAERAATVRAYPSHRPTGVRGGAGARRARARAAREASRAALDRAHDPGALAPASGVSFPAGPPARHVVALTIRLATSRDADVLARHRAEMFKDMGELPAALYDTLVQAARSYFCCDSRRALRCLGGRAARATGGDRRRCGAPAARPVAAPPPGRSAPHARAPGLDPERVHRAALAAPGDRRRAHGGAAPLDPGPRDREYRVARLRRGAPAV